MFVFFTAYWVYYALGLVMIPGLILGAIAQNSVTTNYQKYQQVQTKRGKTSNQICREILDHNDLQQISLTTTEKELGDYYDPKKGTIALSPGVNNQSNISALGIACHEVGHALQDAAGYGPAKMRRFMVPVVNFCSAMLWPLIIIGFLINFGGASNSIIGDICIYGGCAFFGLAIIFSLITLPTELDASKRAIKELRDGQYLDEEELVGAKAVLKAAAMTYFASLLMSVLSFLRFLFTVLLLTRNRD
ncbi:MAG: zinc metallopeptidase [Clostridia bacterium]|nr:zinc metallopeptidase [Clostridia bacterium]